MANNPLRKEKPQEHWWGNQDPPDREERELVEQLVKDHPELTRAEALRHMRLHS